MIRALGLGGLVGIVGCTTTPEPPPPPQLSVVVDEAGPRGAVCGLRFEPVRGPRPPDSRPVARITVTADRPVPLESLEQAARVPALRRCASGLSVLRAEAADGTDAYLSITAEAWDVVVEVEAPPEPTPT